ncbi:MAG: DUF3857 domain-containing protein [Candidatus Eisenbacteria sp.]|nr:DUF3857 domain-containing protein [Candidatus Eisenbacteria bacterium]
MRRVFLPAVATAVLICLMGTARAGDVDFVDIARSAPTAEDFSEADGLILLLDRDVQIHEDERETMILRRAVKILTNQGRREFSDYRFLYDADAQKVDVRTALTVRKNLRTIDVEKDAMNDINPPELEGASVYSNVLERVFSYPASLKGSVLGLDLERETTSSEGGPLGGSVVFQFLQPVVDGAFSLTVPGETKVAYEALGGVPEPQVARSSGRTTYSWRMTDVPRVVPESNMPPMDAVTARLVFATTDDWGRVAGRFADGFFSKVIPGGDLGSAVDEWVMGLATEEEKIREIFLHVVNDVRSVELDLGIGGYEPNPAAEVYHNRYGDCRDKAVLLVAALAWVGIEGFPVLYDHRRMDLVESVPTLKQFNDLMVAVDRPSGCLFLDPGAEHCLFGFYPRGGGNRALLVRPGGFEMVTIPEARHDRNFSEKALHVVVDADGSAIGKAECSLGGHFDHRARRYLAEKTRREREMEFSKAANRLSEGAILGDLFVSDMADLTTAASVSMSFSAESFGLVQGEMMILRLPAFPLQFANLPAYPGLKQRTYDFVMESGFREVYRTELEIPEGYDPVYVPPAYSVENALGWWSVTSAVDEEHRLITIERNIAVKNARIPVEAYPEFKAAFDAVTSPKNSLVLLEKRGP